MQVRIAHADVRPLFPPLLSLPPAPLNARRSPLLLPHPAR
jgi:hypothetical protein